MQYWRIIIVALTVSLFGCASSGVPAGDAADSDGRTLAAKPGHARVYLVQGILVDEAGAPYQPPATLPGDLPGGAVPGAIGAALGTAIREATAKPEDSLPGSNVSSDFYINGQLVGRVARGQYLAIDLLPGNYTFSYVHLSLITHKSNDVTVNLSAGSITYLSSDWEPEHASTILEPCKENCSEVIQKGRRMVAK